MTASRPYGAAEQRQQLDAVASGILILLCACWGLNQVAIKVALTGISPLLQAGLRSIGALLLVFAWAWARRIPLWRRDGTLVPGVVAGLLFSAEFVFIYWGFMFTTASRGVLFLYTTPFLVAIGTHLVVPGDRLTRVKFIGLLAAFAGLAIAFADALRLPTYQELAGDMMCLAGAVLWAATIVLIKASSLARTSSEKTLLYQLAVSAALLPAGSYLLGEEGISSPSWLAIIALIYQTLLVASVSYVAWFWLMTRYPASRLSAFTFLTPVLGVAFGGLLLGEQISPALIASLALIAAGIYLVNRPMRS